MEKELNQKIAIETVGFDFFKQCIKNGATPDQAKKEMLKTENIKIISDRVKEII